MGPLNLTVGSIASMFNQFFRKKYQKRLNGRVWNRSSLIRAIGGELEGFDVKINKNSLTIERETTITLKFHQHQYREKDEISFSVTLIPTPNGMEDERASSYWSGNLNLEALRRMFPDGLNPPIAIKKDEEWNSSALYKDLRSIYIPLFQIFTSSKTCLQFLLGSEVDIGGTKISSRLLESVGVNGTAKKLRESADYYKELYST